MKKEVHVHIVEGGDNQKESYCGYVPLFYCGDNNYILHIHVHWSRPKIWKEKQVCLMTH